MLETIENSTRVLAGGEGELLALRELSPGKHVIVVYRESESDGFIITAFLTSKIKSINRTQDPRLVLGELVVCV